MKIEGDVVVLGGGPGGYVAAIVAAKNGLNTVLVEKDNLGGTCLNRGCIPTKALVRSSEVYELVKESEDFGIFNESPSFDFTKIMERKDNIVKELVAGIEYLVSKNKITLLRGVGDILDKNTVVVKEGKDEGATVSAKNIIIATGSKPFIPPIKGARESKNVYTSDEMLSLKELPKDIVIVGSGVIGMEFAFICSALEVDVTVIGSSDNILANMDGDVIKEITRISKRKKIKLITGARVEEIIDTDDGKVTVGFQRKGKEETVTADKVLMATGRSPNFSDIDLEKLGLELSDRRGIKVNSRLQTTVDNIYAIGDVTNINQLAHVASYQGEVAVANIVGEDVEADYSVVPGAIFTTPEIAAVGPTEEAAKEQGLDISTGKFLFASNGKALTYGERRGLVKVIADKATGVILGGHIIGPHASDLIHEITVAIKNKLTADQIADTIHAHPTTAETVLEAAMATTPKGAIHSA
ncbi:MAG: dihydrolipoyl dehydrogenase [Natronincolaceae bacterium]|jgi:dihydrolipoamide dehydrogenase|nr:dihydrolipoyl dehydrogenase [Bacillota bacterium]NLK90503.1 dihydrolipoyl dehydrogenase [Clostridiales bacterium]